MPVTELNAAYASYHLRRKMGAIDNGENDSNCHLLSVIILAHTSYTLFHIILSFQGSKV